MDLRASGFFKQRFSGLLKWHEEVIMPSRGKAAAPKFPGKHALAKKNDKFTEMRRLDLSRYFLQVRARAAVKPLINGPAGVVAGTHLRSLLFSLRPSNAAARPSGLSPVFGAGHPAGQEKERGAR
eukprot:SAG31_NODE_1162_length_9594_cov_3.045498_10_plen_125_part_00